MTTYRRFAEAKYDAQDGEAEAHVWGKKSYPGVGAILKVRGNDTEDQEVEVAYAGGVSFNLPENSNTEVYLLSSGRDTTLKMVVETPPKDKQRRWKENTGGIQHATDPEHVLEFNNTRAHITKDAFAVGPKGTFEVKDGEVFIRGKLTVQDVITSNTLVKSPQYTEGTNPIAALQNPAEQAPVDQQQGGTGNA